MKKIRVEKITLNIGVGQAGEKLDKAVNLLESISHGKAVKTMTMERIPTWGIRPKLPIGTKITICGSLASPGSLKSSVGRQSLVFFQTQKLNTTTPA